MSALERAAAAAYAGVGGLSPWNELGATAQAHYRQAARAVLMAVLTDDELEGWDYFRMEQKSFRDVLQSILNEEPK